MPPDHAAYTDAVRAAADSALSDYGLPEPVRIEPIRLLNNAVFDVASADGRRFALRVHRPEIRSVEQSLAELTFLAAVHEPLAENGVRVPGPQATKGGELTVTVDLGGTAAAPERLHCDLLTWVDGRVHRPEAGLGPVGVRQIGRALAHLHRAAAAFEPPPGFSVPTWDAEAMFTERSPYHPGPFRDHLDRADLEVFDAVAEQTARIFEALGDDGDAFGLIHNDFILGNCHPIRTSRGWSVGVIDFDECGWGHFLYDLAPVMGNLSDYPHFRRLRAAFLDGYRSVRTLPEHLEAHLPVLMAARHANHVLWASGLEHSNGSPEFDTADHIAYRMWEVRRCLAMSVAP